METDANGQQGNVSITTPLLNVQDNIRISASATEKATRAEQPDSSGDLSVRGGNFTINASQINLSGTSGLFAETKGAVPAGNLNIRPYKNDPNISINFQDGTQISTSTSSSGRGGDINVSAPDSVIIQGPGQLSAQATGNGRAGSVEIETEHLSVRNRAEILASNVSSRSSGITLRGLDVLEILGGSQISASTQLGEAGNIIINNNESAASRVDISGKDSLVAAQASGDGGEAGNITFNTQQFNARERAQVTISSLKGEAGSLEIQAEEVRLDNASLNAITGAGESSGQIEINVSGDVLRFSNNSLISAEALEDADGGNITLSVEKGFIIGGAFENSDIIANAERGDGGNINIITQLLIGFEERQGLTFDELRSNLTSDISASSEFGQQGTITTTTLDLDPREGLAELPVIKPSPPIQRGCSAEAVGTSSFTVTGRGGLPPSPTDILTRERIMADLGPETEASTSPDRISMTEPDEDSFDPIVEAQGFIKDANGQVTFVAKAPGTIPHAGWQQPVQCSGH